INLRVFQQTPARGLFNIVEKNVWNYANAGTWTEANGVHTLDMGGSGTSGTLRFVSGNERFIITVGVHNFERWCDIVPNLAAGDTGGVIIAEYYNAGPRAPRREAQLDRLAAVTNLGAIVAVVF
ncbi:lectin, partial [Gyrodon lividus]